MNTDELPSDSDGEQPEDPNLIKGPVVKPKPEPIIEEPPKLNM